MKYQTWLRGSIDLYWRLLAILVSTAFLAMLAVMLIQVFSRHLIGQGVPWTDEASRYLFLASIFLGSVLAMKTGDHITIPLIIDMLSERVRNIVLTVADGITITILGLLILGSWNMMERTAGIMASTFALSFSMVYLMQLVSVALMIVYLVVHIFLRLQGRVRDARHDTGASV